MRGLEITVTAVPAYLGMDIGTPELMLLFVFGAFATVLVTLNRRGALGLGILLGLLLGPLGILVALFLPSKPRRAATPAAEE